MLPDNGRDRHIPGIDSLLPQKEIVAEDIVGDILEKEDGSAEIELPREEKREVPFSANLAEVLEESELGALAQDLLRKIEADRRAREKRDRQYEEGLRRTGLAGDAPGGANFEGASRAVHPMLTECCIDFAASAMRELFPPNGPVKTKIEGEANPEKLEVAKRQQRYLNWQLTEQIEEYASDLEQCLTQVPMGGSQYMKFWFDATLKRVACEFVPIDDVYIPFSASDFHSAHRITHVQRLLDSVFRERIETGMYRDIEAGEAGEAPERSSSAEASDRIEGKESDENIDGERIVYEVNTFAKLSVDGNERLPYLVSIDERTGKILSIYRNWDENDPSRSRLDWMVEYGFIAWRGAYKLGFPHLIGGLAAAATGALRALLDSAHINNMPAFLRLKGARLGGSSKTINPLEGIEIDAAVDDIRRVAMQLPYGQPSPVLFQLLGWLTEAAKGVVTTAEEKIRDASNQMPVGTTLALIEQGAKVFSSIHARLHRSQTRAFRIIGRLNAKHISISEQLSKIGEVLATREDFAKPLAVAPVSDPNIFSETQRYAQMQMVLSLATAAATAPLHDLYKTLKRTYELAKIPNIDEFLIEPKKPQELNAAAENTAALLGQPIIAFPHQDHLAHIETHIRFAIDPFLGGAPFSAQRSLPSLMEHIKQHLGFLYARTIFDIANEHLGMDITEMLRANKSDPRVDMVLAAASKLAHEELKRKLLPLGPVVQELLKRIAATQPPMPVDPSQTAIMVARTQAQVDAERNAIAREKAAMEAKLKEAELQRKAAKDAADIALKAEEMKLDAQLEAEKVAAQREHQQLQMMEMQEEGNQIPGV